MSASGVCSTATVSCPKCTCTLKLSIQHSEGEMEGEPGASMAVQPLPRVLPLNVPPPPHVPLVAPQRRCTSWAFSKLAWGIGKVASVFCGSASTQLTSGSCFNLGVKAVSRLKDVQELSQVFTKINTTVSGSTTLATIKEMIIQKFSVETLAEFSACGQAGLDSLKVMPSSALLVAIAVDTIASQVLLAAIGASWVTTALQVGASFYASSYVCGSTVTDVKELVIGYTVYRLANGIYNYMRTA